MGRGPNYVTVFSPSSIFCLWQCSADVVDFPRRWHNIPIIFLLVFLHLLAILHLFLQLFHTCSVSCSLSAWSLFLFILFVPARSAILILLFRYRTFRIFHRNFVIPVADVTHASRNNLTFRSKLNKYFNTETKIQNV